MPPTTTQLSPQRRHTIFDLRWILSFLFGIYGAVLVLTGATATTTADLAKTGGWNINLWSGLAMVAFAALTAIWALLRPVIIVTEAPAQLEEPLLPTENAVGA